MPRPTFESVHEYIAAQPAGVQPALERVRSTIHKALPGAEEAISYGIPAFKLNGRVVIFFAGFKAHYSIYPSTRRLEAAFRQDLVPYEVNGKGTIRFPLNAPVPVRLIGKIAKFKAAEAAGVATASAQRRRSGSRRARVRVH